MLTVRLQVLRRSRERRSFAVRVVTECVREDVSSSPLRRGFPPEKIRDRLRLRVEEMSGAGDQVIDSFVRERLAGLKSSTLDAATKGAIESYFLKHGLNIQEEESVRARCSCDSHAHALSGSSSARQISEREQSDEEDESRV